MKSQYLALFSASTAIAISMILTAGKSATASQAVFYCQSNDGTPTTVAKASNGAEQPIFHWNLDQNSIPSDTKQLCDSVTQKLNDYAAEGNDLSSLTFKAWSNYDPEDILATEEFPAVCVAKGQENCALELFTLNAVGESEDAMEVASSALDSILDPALQAAAQAAAVSNPPKSGTRGVQKTAYQVNFWDLFGF